MLKTPSDSTDAFARGLLEAGSRVEPLLEEMFPRDRADFLSAPFWHHMGTGGKRLRPALCIRCCEELGGEADQAIPFAAAVEILHNMFLVHDDLEDGDTVRRDAPTVWVRFGMENAVNLGDYMLGRAYAAILSSPVELSATHRLLTAFTETYERTCRGQALDVNWRGREDLTVEQYLEMVTLKTGDYLALGMVGGAIIAGLPDGSVAQIRQLGSNMGPAFQVRDDVIDLTLGKGRGGALGNDIREGKPSILYAHALSAASGEDRRRLLEIIRKPREETTDADVREVIALYGRLGSLDFARRTADELVRQAFETIERIPVENKDFFRQAARFMAERTT
jgi:geranylgeranyl pyrophosphate synthase